MCPVIHGLSVGWNLIVFTGKKLSIAVFRSLVKDNTISSDDGLGPSPLNHLFLVEHKPNPFKPDWGYRRVVLFIHVLLLSLQIQYRQEITCQKPRPRRVLDASRPRLRVPADSFELRLARIRSASAGARRRVYPRELLAFVARGRADGVNI